MVAFRASALVAQGNIPRERVAAFAPVAFDAAHRLTVLVEKPDAATLAAFGDDPWVSMNLWRFDHRILAACRATPRSVRGEHELPEAVRLAIWRYTFTSPDEALATGAWWNRELVGTSRALPCDQVATDQSP